MEASGNNKYLPPQSIDAEQALLGACLLDQEALNNALEYIRAEDFYREDHRLIFACMEKLTAEGAPCDLITVVDALQLSNNLNGAGDIAYIASLANSLPATSSAVYYAKIIAEKSMLRSLITVGKQINEESYFAFNDADAVLENAEKSIFDISERKIKKSFHHIGPIAVEVMEQIGKIKASDGITGIPTFRDLDNLLTGLKKSDLIILAARPGMGKTSMALNIAQNAACKHGYTVAIFSLEMPKEQLVQRMLCSAAGVDQGKARSGKISSEEMSLLSKNIGPLAKAEIYIDDSAGISVMEMRSKCRKLKMEKKALDLVVIDYLQLMQSTAKRQENRQQEIAEISRSLKALAKELDVPVLALSQLSRLADRSNEPPSLSHLRESGALEQDADVVVFIHRQKDEEMDDDTVDVIVAKHRNGPVGAVKMLFLPQFTKFVDFAQSFIGDEPNFDDSSLPPEPF